MKFYRSFLFISPIVVCALFLLEAGCKEKNAIKDYQVPKAETESTAPEAHAHGTPSTGAVVELGARTGSPTFISDKAPAGWMAQPLSSMRQASYLVKGDGGATADISLVLLAGPAGGVLDNINRWLTQLGKPAITSDQLTKIAQKVTTSIGEATVVDIEGLPEGGDPAKDGRIVAGIISGPDGSYFFKMRGNAALAETQKAAFIGWVSSVQKPEAGTAAPAVEVPGALPISPACPVVGPDGKAKQGATTAPTGAAEPSSPAACPVIGATPGAAPATAMAAAPAPVESAEKPQVKWEVPEGWKTVPPSSMRYASFALAGPVGQAGDISVSTFSGEGGGDLENVNRWRSQVGLEAIGVGELKALVVPVACKDGEILTVDMAGPSARILAAWTRTGGRSWFFKLTGPVAVVEDGKSGFVKFLQSIQFQP